MVLSTNTGRRTVAVGFGTGAIVGAMLMGAAVTAAADPPNCTAADLANVSSGVSAATSTYLFANPDVNAFFTGLKGQPRSAIADDVQNYLNANPKVQGELQGIRQPLIDFKNGCGVPTTNSIVPEPTNAAPEATTAAPDTSGSLGPAPTG